MDFEDEEMLNEPFADEEADEEENGAGGGDDEAEEVDENGKKIGKKKVKVPKNPNAKKTINNLDEMTKKLVGPRGFKDLYELVSAKKFHKSADSEFKNLAILIASSEYWAHRLYPNLRFSDAIERLERLGERRDVRAALARYQSEVTGINEQIDELNNRHNDDENNENENNENDLLRREFNVASAAEDDEEARLLNELLGNNNY